MKEVTKSKDITNELNGNGVEEYDEVDIYCAGACIVPIEGSRG